MEHQNPYVKHTIINLEKCDTFKALIWSIIPAETLYYLQKRILLIKYISVITYLLHGSTNAVVCTTIPRPTQHHPPMLNFFMLLTPTTEPKSPRSTSQTFSLSHIRMVQLGFFMLSFCYLHSNSSANGPKLPVQRANPCLSGIPVIKGKYFIFG